MRNDTSGCTDERILQARRQIGSEMMLLIYYFIVIAFCIKTLFFGIELQNCLTEFIILIGAPLYQAYRSRKLGIVLGDYRKASKPSNIIAIGIGLILLLLSLRRSAGGWNSVGAIAGLISFAAAFIFARFGFAKLEKRRAEKLEKEYED